ncbi:MAG: S8 family serine peptidase [Flavobacteriales bacterium]|nr:S8 family serine peptidase [Flavobacteriales bacterium]
MVNKLLYFPLVLLLIVVSPVTSFAQKFGFNEVLRTAPHAPTTFCVPNNDQNRNALRTDNQTVKYSTKDWLFITTTPTWIDDAMRDQKITNFYFETAPPVLLADTARVAHHVEEVHAGVGGLQTPFTGKDVIIGYVDTGIDFNHEDFKNEDGSTRVLRYWDHSLTGGPSPGTYGYGVVWDSSAINNGTCTSMDDHSHGTTVAGFGSGNARANGRMKGMAPESDIIIVESNLGGPNWSLTIADACDYIFKVADSLGKPAVVNLSLGTYFGSHDGNDPASEAMEAMLDSQPGRIIVAAAGNSGLSGKAHLHNNVTSDTSFVWFKTNPAAMFGANTIYFDLWSDLSDATFEFSFSADKAGPDYELRGTTGFHTALPTVGTVIYDTIWSENNDVLAIIECYPEQVGSNFNMQVLFWQIDSTDYLFRFNATNSGAFDIWSGSWHGYNDMETTIPTVAQFPDIANYIMPDSLQSIVSGWNCSEKVISVGNVQNRLGHIDGNGNQYLSPGLNPPGKLALKSSKGPNRHNVVKPDVSAAGEVSLAAAPLWVQTIPQAYVVLDSGLLHMRNSGTSMSSPLVAGVAALYLEKCSNATYNDFKTDLINTAFSDSFTGSLPNYGYGHGKVHALDLLLATNYTTSFVGPLGICEDPIDIALSSTQTIPTVNWSNGGTTSPLTVDTVGNYSAIVFDDRGCIHYTDTLAISQFEVPFIDPITWVGDTLFTNSTHDYQWTLNGNDLPGETNAQLTVSSPFGTYTCYATSPDGCVAETNPITLTLSLDEASTTSVKLHPNPVSDFFSVQSDLPIQSIELIDALGKRTTLNYVSGQGYDVRAVTPGLYIVLISTKSGVFQSKIVRM